MGGQLEKREKCVCARMRMCEYNIYIHIEEKRPAEKNENPRAWK